MQDNDTIFAVASGSGRAAIAVMRVSGPDAARVLEALCGSIPPVRRASLRVLRGPAGETLDHAVVLWLPGPSSYTGEDSTELHLHAGPAVIAGVADALAALGARPAEAGEFTRRAFRSGKLDLLEAEAIGDLVAAETEAQRRQALRQLEGALGDLYGDWAMRIQTMLAQQEVLIDFPDEDLPPDVEAGMLADMRALRREIGAHLADCHRGEKLREGLVFVVAGAPNVGKSSLVNALAGREVAIVSDLPGTTRDAIETRVIFGGAPVTLTDTAGLCRTADAVEAEGVRRAEARVRTADLVLLVMEAGTSGREPVTGLGNAPVLNVATKTDLGGAVRPGWLGVSARTEAGLTKLRAALDARADDLIARAGPPPLTRARHRSALERASAALESAGTVAAAELRGEELRVALRALGTITGAVGVEDILGTIFGSFCIGK